MRTLYLPSNGRFTSKAKTVIEFLAQNTVSSDRDGLMYTSVNSVVSELELYQAVLDKCDLRPWLSDTQSTGELVPVNPETETRRLTPTSYNDLLYGAPDTWSFVKLRSYDWDHQATPSIRAVEIESGVVIQDENNEYYALENNNAQVRLYPEAAINYPDTCLVSDGPGEYNVYIAGKEETFDRSCDISNLRIILGAAGNFEVEVYFTSAINPDNDIDLTELPYFDSLGSFYIDGENFGTFSVSNNIFSYDEADLVEGQDPLLFYTGKATYTYKTPAQRVGQNWVEAVGTISIEEILQYCYSMPTPKDVKVQEIEDTVCFVPGPTDTGLLRIDRAGFVGPVSVGHEIEFTLPSHYHTLVAGQANGVYVISLVEHDATRIMTTKRIEGLDVHGLTFTREGHLGFIARTSEGFDVYRLLDVRNRTADGFRLP